MKICPRCGQGYTDSSINFCLNDGDLLVAYGGEEPKTLFSDQPQTQFEDSPPTAVMDPSKVTNPTAWQPSQPPAPWQNQAPFQNQTYGPAATTRSRDQTLPTISLVLGIVSCVVVCCYGGIWLGAPAAVIGFLAMRNADSDPNRYGGRGLAIGGMVLGTITFLISLVLLFVGVIAR